MITLISSDTPSPFMMVASMSRCSSPRRVGHKLSEFAPTKTFKGHVKDDKKARR